MSDHIINGGQKKRKDEFCSKERSKGRSKSCERIRLIIDRREDKKRERTNGAA